MVEIVSYIVRRRKAGAGQRPDTLLRRSRAIGGRQEGDHIQYPVLTITDNHPDDKARLSGVNSHVGVGSLLTSTPLR